MLPLSEGNSGKRKKINECILELSAGKGKKLTRGSISPVDFQLYFPSCKDVKIA